MGVWGQIVPNAPFERLQLNTCGFIHAYDCPQRKNKTVRLIVRSAVERGIRRRPSRARMQRYKKGNWSVASVVAGRSSWLAKGNNSTGHESEGVPILGVLCLFCPKLLGHLCSGEAQKGTQSS